jgi:hypothetical protein
MNSQIKKDHKHRCHRLGCNRSFKRIGDLKQHENCLHPDLSTPKYWCTASDCLRSKRHPNAKPFFRRDRCEKHKKTCPSLKAVRQTDVDKHTFTSINGPGFLAQDTCSSEQVRTLTAAVQGYPKVHQFGDTFLHTSLDNHTFVSVDQWPHTLGANAHISGNFGKIETNSLMYQDLTLLYPGFSSHLMYQQIHRRGEITQSMTGSFSGLRFRCRARICHSTGLKERT